MINSTFDAPDPEYWESFLKGDKEAYTCIYKQYFPLLYEYGMRLCRDAEVTKDCIQDLFIKMWLNRRTLRATTRIKPYLFCALRTTILNRMEQAHRMAKRAVRAVDMRTFDLHYTNIEDSLIGDDEVAIHKQRIKAALNKLTSHQKECIFLRFYMGLEYAEIAEAMKVSVKASYKIIGRAIALMREHFKETTSYSFILLLLFSMV